MILAIVGASIVAVNKVLTKEVPIVGCIGLEPVLDETRDRFRRDTVRNLVYENSSSDLNFYSEIIQKVESCEWVKKRGLEKKGDFEGDLFALADSPYPRDSLMGKTCFSSEDTRFTCVIYDGDHFVVVVLTALH